MGLIFMITLMITVMETGCILAESGPVKSFDSELRVNFLRRSVCQREGKSRKRKSSIVKIAKRELMK